MRFPTSVHRIMLALVAAAISGGIASGPAYADDVRATRTPAPAADTRPVTPLTTHHTRLWTQVGSGRNGYADITHTYHAVDNHGHYAGELTGTLNHYAAPPDRQVVVMFRIDGTLGGYSRLTKTSTTFRKTYPRPGLRASKVSARICLHRPGVPITLNSGVSYCSAWWG